MFGNLLNTLNSARQNVGKSVEGFVNNTLPQTYSSNHPILNTIFGVNKAYAAEPTKLISPVPSSNTLPQAGGSYNPSGGSVQGASIYSPASYGGGGASSSGGLISPNFSNPNPSTNDQLSLLQQAFGNAQNQINQQSPLLDSSYNQAKTDINNAITSAQGRADQQNQLIDTGIGQGNLSANQTYKDLQNRERGTFSGLGTLDSSAYSDAVQKADQDLANTIAGNNKEGQMEKTGVQNTLTDYMNGANSQLATLANQYQAGKNAIANALAQNNLGEASAIQQALAQIQANAQQIQNSMVNFANQQALYGMNGSTYGQTMSAVNGYSPQNYLSKLSGVLSGVQQNGANTFQLPNLSGITPYLGGQVKRNPDGSIAQ